MQKIALALIFCIATVLPAQAQHVEWEPREPGPNDRTYFDQNHSADFASAALAELSGASPDAGASREELAQATLDMLSGLPAYGQKETANIKPPIPQWLLDGYARFQPTTVQRSRYFNGVLDGSLSPSADIATLYTAWCAYDAEWFSLSRQPAYKAWLSALLLTYPPSWAGLGGESAAALHSRLVVPLQTKDEPYREIDNWIKNFTDVQGSFLKPKVRDALVEELLAKAGLESDQRFFEDPAYAGPAPGTLSLSPRQFFLAAALVLEFHYELYQLDAGTKQPLWFRDYFLEMYRQNL